MKVIPYMGSPFLICLYNFVMQLFGDLNFFFFTRVVGRALCTAAKSVSSDAAPAPSTARMERNTIGKFFETNKSPDEHKPVVNGRVSFLLSYCFLRYVNLIHQTQRHLVLGFHSYYVLKNQSQVYPLCPVHSAGVEGLL